MKILIKILTIILVGVLFIKVVDLNRSHYVIENGNDAIIRYYGNERVV
jgi:hypothetical protein